MITFENAITHPVSIEEKANVLRIFYRQGFVILSGNSFPKGCDSPAQKLTFIEGWFRLGTHTISDFNKTFYPERIAKEGYNKIGQPPVPVEFEHTAFDSNEGQGLHVDGIFRPSGELKTIALACAQSAIKGGENTLCNMSRVVDALRQKGDEWVTPLMSPESICRRSFYENNDRMCIAPILSYDSLYKREIINFSDDETVDWDYSANRVPWLARSVKLMRHIMTTDARVQQEVKVETGDVLLFDNNTLTHGRKPFIDSPAARRIMIRGKYKRLPS
jgi:alpha-ketoglutarate-dependent taurine dioxygenase